MARSKLSGALERTETVSVPERGHADISGSTWEKLEKTQEFRRLLKHGIVKASVRSERGMRLEGSCFVGRAMCGEVALELREKIDGALIALLGHATRDAFRIERAGAPASELGDLAVLLVRQFLEAVTIYASRGREFQYRQERRIGSLVGGRLDVTKSIQLRARGLGHRLAFYKNTLSFDTPVNRIVLAALREVERLAGLVSISIVEVSRARGLAMLFADSRDAEILFGQRETFISQSESLLGMDLAPATRDIVALAGVILSHESFEHGAEATSSIPRSWFLNLERLFENAVRTIFQSVLGATAAVSRGEGHSTRIFGEVVGEYTANPDLVVHDGARTTAIGDVKYKNWTRSASNADVYQLLVHTAAFECDRSFLVFPSDRFESRRLGTSATGSDVWFFAVDVRDLRAGISAIARNLGLVVSA